MSSAKSGGEDLASASGPYGLKPLLEDVGISADGGTSDIQVSCLEYWEGNLYIGTNTGEVLHFVSIPGEPAEDALNNTFILASRFAPSATADGASSDGVRQIMVLPHASKACILCNGTLSFHSLPELSPAAGHKSLKNCLWIGARDLDLEERNDGGEDEDVVMITMRNRIRLVRIGREQRPQLVRDIEYPGCLAAARRSRFACVANSQSYALLDVENQQQIPLFPISSLNRPTSIRPVEGPSPSPTQHTRSISAIQSPGESTSERSLHNRAASLGGFVGSLGVRQPDSRSLSRERLEVNDPHGRTRALSPDIDSWPLRRSSAQGSPAPASGSSEKPLPPPPPDLAIPTTEQAAPVEVHFLQPQVTSPLPTEFLLTTGTAPDEPGVGIFVNCDGDVVRGTLEFSQYPSVVVLDGTDANLGSSTGNLSADTDGYVLALIDRSKDSGRIALEIQRWDVTGEAKAWLTMVDERPTAADSEPNKVTTIPTCSGITAVQTPISFNLQDVVQKLRLRRFRLGNSSSQAWAEASSENAELARNQQEDQFAQRLGQASSHIIVFSRRSVSWAFRNPVLLRLDAMIEQALQDSSESRLDQAKLVRLLSSIRNQEARSEAEFLSLDYIRQKIALVLFADLAVNQDDVDPGVNEQLLLEGGTDPRVMLSMVPLLRDDIVEGPEGIWIHDGLVNLMRDRFSSTAIAFESDEVLSRPEEFDIVGLIKRYLAAWRQKKGFGSISDEVQVSATVDAALIHILLHQDQQSSIGPGTSSSLRAELYAVVDHNVDCWDRAVQLLERYKRLYVLSRLYQSRNMRGNVLATWRRILDGEKDEGGEFADGESELRKYLTKTKDIGLVEEYGTWLAKRNPPLGVQVFTDDTSRVKLPPNQVVQLLKLRAPEAVKVYLEHVVFGKKNVQYANELISYYLDNVLDVLKSSEDARSVLSQSYQTYRVLGSPRPTYREFITDNAISAPWWADRLRLLELLGGSHGAGFSYDVSRVLERIEPFEAYLVPESIILDGRQGRHQQALRLLVHALGDYHTAINYCLLGGSSIFHPATPSSTGTTTSTVTNNEGAGGSAPLLPSRAEQTVLFKHLFEEFLLIEDSANRMERTGELLGRFASWFDVQEVLAAVPDEWPIELMSAFLTGTFRKLVQDKCEASVTKALRGAENLRVSVQFAEKCEEHGPHVVPAVDTPNSMV